MPSTPQLARLNRLLGSWTTEATHPEMPGVVVHGTATMEWLEGEKFLITRSRTDHPAFPDGITIIGDTRQDRADGFSQRFTGTFGDNGNTIVGQSQLRRDDVTWVDDLRITYRRQR